MKTVKTKNAPQAIGPYSQAVIANGFIFCSGQIGIDPKTGNLAEGLENQTKQIIKNIEAVLKEAGLNLECIVKTTIFLTNINDFAKVNEIYGSFFTNHNPARSTIAVAALPKGALIEIEAIALK